MKNKASYESSDFNISAKRKKIFSVELDLFNKFVEICNKYSLKYYAINGTLLGTIRHDGFIPWDDDLDVAMPRNDYEKFKQVSEIELVYPYVLQNATEKTDYYLYWTRLRRVDTTAISLKNVNNPVLCGIFIDIFPIDGIPSNHNYNYLKIQFLSALANTYCHYPYITGNKYLRQNLLCLSKIYVKKWGYKNLIENIENTMMLQPYDYTDKVFVRAHSKEFLQVPKEFFGNGLQRTFENTTIIVPDRYNEILIKQYGKNYMEYPPVNKRGNHHSIFFDPDRPYTDYLNADLSEIKKGINNF